MASNAYLSLSVVIHTGDREYRLGTGSIPLPLALTSPGGIDSRSFDIATATDATLWDASTSPAGSFKFLAIVSDKAMLLELQGTAVADNHHAKLYPGLPFILGDDDTLRYNALSFTGAADNFKKILARNSSGSTATVQVLICE